MDQDHQDSSAAEGSFEPTTEQPGPETPNASPSSAAAEPTEGEPVTGAPTARVSEENEKATVSDGTWAAAARGVIVWVLLGMALVVWFRLSFGRSWIYQLLAQNQMDMTSRVFFILEILAGGAIGAAGSGFYLYRRRNKLDVATTEVERVAWVCSPLMLLPMIPVFGAHEVWFGQHRILLPIVLFGGVIAEFLFGRSARYLPELELGSFDLSARLTPWLRKNWRLTLIVTSALVYGAFMSFFTVRWHHRLGTAIFDLGINTNLIHGGLSGKINYSTVIFPDEPVKYWANHVKLGLFLFLPFYAVIQKPETLLVIQSISLGLGAIPLFLFARRRLPETSAMLVALAYLCWVPMHSANFYEMKEPPTAAAMVLTMVWAFDVKKVKLGWVFFFLSMIMREDMPIPLATIGMVYLLSGYRPRTGILMALVGAVWFVFLRFKVMNEAGAWWFPNMYESLWSQPEKGFRSVIKTLLSNPTYVLRHFFVEKKFWYLMHMFVPLVFLPARRWYLWAAFVPGAILTLLVTDYDPPILQSFQYVMHWGPYLFLAAILALEAIGKEEVHGPAKRAGAVAAIVVSSLALTYNYGAFSMRDKTLQTGFTKVRFSWTAAEQKTYEQVLELSKMVPKNASVAATEHLGAHFAAREYFYTLRRGHHDADYVALRSTELRLDKTRDSIKDALRSKKYGLVKHLGEFYLLKKGAPSDGNQEILEDLGLGSKAKRTPPKRPEPDADDDGENPDGPTGE